MRKLIFSSIVLCRKIFAWLFCKINTPLYSPSLAALYGPKCLHCNELHGNLLQTYLEHKIAEIKLILDALKIFADNESNGDYDE